MFWSTKSLVQPSGDGDAWKIAETLPKKGIKWLKNGEVEGPGDYQDKMTPISQLQSEDASTSDKATAYASLSMRERLALAKGKSKLATSKFGSTLKSAKLAASEISRDDIKQQQMTTSYLQSFSTLS